MINTLKRSTVLAFSFSSPCALQFSVIIRVGTRMGENKMPPVFYVQHIQHFKSAPTGMNTISYPSSLHTHPNERPSNWE